MGDDFEDSADGVAGFERGVYFGFHFFFGRGIHAAEGGFQIAADVADLLPGRGAIEFYMAHLDGVAGDLRAEFAEK